MAPAALALFICTGKASFLQGPRILPLESVTLWKGSHHMISMKWYLESGVERGVCTVIRGQCGRRSEECVCCYLCSQPVIFHSTSKATSSFVKSSVYPGVFPKFQSDHGFPFLKISLPLLLAFLSLSFFTTGV